jgi:pyruvate dehydrogenase E1 component alpha subunit
LETLHPVSELKANQILEMLQQMLTIREFEIFAKKQMNAGNLPGFIHMAVGQEANAVGVCANLRRDDAVVGTHRSHHHSIAKGCDLKRMFDELRGAETGLCRGKGGSMHIIDMEKGMYGANGIVGGGFPMSVGIALGFKHKGKDNVAVCYFSDGASNQGTFHEALNLASIWKLPVVFFSENNGFAEDTAAFYSTSVKNISERAAAYSIPGLPVNGGDLFEVYEAAKMAIERARKGEGPTLIESRCYRIYGHYQDDPARYKTKEYLRLQEEFDPVKRLKEYILSKGVATGRQLELIEDKASKDVHGAWELALKSPMPRPEEALEDTYANYP